MDALARIEALQEQLEALKKLLEFADLPNDNQLRALMRRNEELLDQVCFLQMLLKNINNKEISH